jgi:hypothetical protein
MDWATAMRQHPEFLITSVEMTDWQMLVEKWENAHNMPRFTRDDQPQGPRRFTTTLQYLRASRGQITYEDHQTPWSIVCPNLDFTLGNVPNYHGRRCSTAARCRFRTTSRCGPTCARVSC